MSNIVTINHCSFSDLKKKIIVGRGELFQMRGPYREGVICYSSYHSSRQKRREREKEKEREEEVGGG
jgi:hypothetical protein